MTLSDLRVRKLDIEADYVARKVAADKWYAKERARLADDLLALLDAPEETHAEPVAAEPAPAHSAPRTVEAPAAETTPAPTAGADRGPRRPRNATQRLMGLGYSSDDIAQMSYAEMRRILPERGPGLRKPPSPSMTASEPEPEPEPEPAPEPPAAERTGPVTAEDLGWSKGEIASLRPGQEALIVAELRLRSEWAITVDRTLVRRVPA